MYSELWYEQSYQSHPNLAISSLPGIQTEPQLCLEDLEVALPSHFQFHPSLQHPFKHSDEKGHLILLSPHIYMKTHKICVIYEQNGSHRVKFVVVALGLFWRCCFITKSHYGNHRSSIQEKIAHPRIII